MEYRRIEYFLVLAEELSYAAAAKKLFITSQALTKQIFLLEEELGTRLFNRTTRKVTLTPAGEICRDKFSYLKDVYDTTLEEVRLAISDEKKIVKIGVFAPLPKNELILPFIENITAAFDDIEIDIYATGMGEIREGLLNGVYDIGLTNAHDFQDWIGFERVNFKVAPAQIVVSRRHKWVKEGKNVITEQDMAEESILLLDTHSGLEKNSFYRNVKAKERRRANDFDTMLMMLETGRDYAVFPMVFNAAASSKMVCFDLPSKYAFNYRTMCAAKAHNSKPEIRKIMNYIKKNQDKFEFQM